MQKCINLVDLEQDCKIVDYEANLQRTQSLRSGMGSCEGSNFWNCCPQYANWCATDCEMIDQFHTETLKKRNTDCRHGSHKEAPLSQPKLFDFELCSLGFKSLRLNWSSIPCYSLLCDWYHICRVAFHLQVHCVRVQQTYPFRTVYPMLLNT